MVGVPKGVRVEGVGPGTIVDGRYTLQDRTAQEDGFERWSAQDTTLGREVVLLTMPGEGHRTEDALDAARRAAGVDHPTLVRILDVGRDGAIGYVVEESLAGSHSLAELVRDGGLPGEEARRIAGEVSSALESGRARGLHHLRLSPDEIFRTADGEIRLRSLATAAALTGAADAAGEDAPRRDAVGSVSVAYAALTGLWPGGTQTSLPAAPEVVGGVPAPSEIAMGVPRDLDGLCRLTLNDHQGPTTPGDFARQIAPWSSRPIIGRPTVLTTLVSPAEPEPEPVADAAPEPETESASVPEVAPAAEATQGSGAENTAVTQAIPLGEQEAVTSGATTSGAGALSGATKAAGAGAAAVAGAAGAVVTGAVGAMGAAARRAHDLAEDKIAERREHAAAVRASAGGSKDLDTVTQRDIEPPAPLVPAEPLTKDESRVALGIVAAFVVLSLIVGLWGVSRIGSNTKIDLGGLPASHSSTSAPAGPSPSASTGASGSVQPLQILAANGFDPLGDGTENNGQAPKVFDGKNDTEWTSERYNSADFGGLKKGTGISVDLGPNVQARQITIVMPVAADVEVYVNGDQSLDGATKVGAKQNASGTVVFPVPDTAKGQYIIVWFTKLTQDSEGKYRAHLAEITVLG
jgi:hypothetical protein